MTDLLLRPLYCGPGWRDSGLLQRRKIFLAAAAALRSRADEVAAVETRETTANLAYARAGIGAVIECLEETAALATALKGELVYGAHGQEAFVERVPYGVVFAIAPCKSLQSSTTIADAHQ